jgi:hypothetical protein
MDLEDASADGAGPLGVDACSGCPIRDSDEGVLESSENLSELSEVGDSYAALRV